MGFTIKSPNMKYGTSKFWSLAPFCLFDTLIMQVDESVFPLALTHI